MEGHFKTYYDDGKLLQSTHYSEGKKSGKSYRYWNNEKPASEECYSEDLLIEGRYWNINGKLISEVIDGNGIKTLFGKDSVSELQEIKNGIIEGEIQSFDGNGVLIRSWNIMNGLKHGDEVVYFPNRSCEEPLKKQLVMQWSQGKIQGVTKSWYNNGIQESQREMSGNKKNGILTGWYTDGSLMLMEEYDQDKIIRGEYYKKGDRIPVSEIKEGTGTATIFDSEGHFKYRINYVKSMIDKS